MKNNIDDEEKVLVTKQRHKSMNGVYIMGHLEGGKCPYDGSLTPLNLYVDDELIKKLDELSRGKQ